MTPRATTPTGTRATTRTPSSRPTLGARRRAPNSAVVGPAPPLESLQVATRPLKLRRFARPLSKLCAVIRHPRVHELMNHHRIQHIIRHMLQPIRNSNPTCRWCAAPPPCGHVPDPPNRIPPCPPAEVLFIQLARQLFQFFVGRHPAHTPSHLSVNFLDEVRGAVQQLLFTQPGWGEDNRPMTIRPRINGLLPTTRQPNLHVPPQCCELLGHRRSFRGHLL